MNIKKSLIIILILFLYHFSFSQCSYISGLLVNACGGSAEGINEMVVMTMGDNDVDWDDITLTYSSAGTYCNSCTKTFTTNSSFVSSKLESDCPSEDLIIEVGIDTDIIPSGGVLIIFTGSSPTFDFDFSNLCATGPYYVMFANNVSTTGRFANSANANRTTSYDIDGCTGSATYYSSSSNTGSDGDGVSFSSDGTPTYVNSCSADPVIISAVPLFFEPIEIEKEKIISIDETEEKKIFSIHNIIGKQLYLYNYLNDEIVDLQEFKKEDILIVKYFDGSVKKIKIIDY